MSDEQPGKVDLVSVLYIVGGIPATVVFLFLLFIGAKACGIPA